MSRFPKLAVAGVALTILAGQGAPTKQTQPLAKQTSRAADAGAIKKLGIGREATVDEVAAWDIDVRPDGQGLPPGKGTAAKGEEIFQTQCASCHGEFGEGKDRWPVLSGGHGTLKADRPDKTIGSYWPAASTLFDYMRRAMPYGNAQSLSSDELYALTAYILHMNEVIKDAKFELSRENFTSIRLPNQNGFYDDDRETSERAFWKAKVCMTNCKTTAEVLNRARSVDVTPETKGGPKVH